jgi:hypothetical protein
VPLCSVTHSSVLATVLRVPVGYRPTSADSVAGVTATATLSAVLVRRRNSGSAFDFHERKFRIKALIGMNWIHISDDDLERYYLSMVTTEEEVAPLEEHMLACPSCAKHGLKRPKIMWTPCESRC